MIVFFLDFLVLVLAGIGSLAVGGLVLNNPPLYDAPGFGRRLLTYLTTNVAETRRDHPFPELELRCYRLSPTVLFSRIEQAVEALGWEILERNPECHHLHARASTPLLKFQDDLEIRLAVTGRGTEVHVRSSSRVGKGDLGANSRHILDLFQILARQA
jgi:uncharacterized protein (DUF1499 family)